MVVSFFDSFLNILKNKAPIKAPYKEELTGLEVMAQVPEAQPTKYQYDQPAAAPRRIPVSSSLYLIVSFFITVQIYTASKDIYGTFVG